MVRVWTVVLALFVCNALCGQLYDELLPTVHLQEDGQRIIKCATTEAWQLRRLSNSSGCATEGVCDSPSVRDNSPEGELVIQTVLHIFQNSAGVSPTGNNGKPIDTKTIDAQMLTLDMDYGPSNVQFKIVETQYHKDNKFFCIPPYDDSDDWYDAILEAKNKYAKEPTKYLNIFVTCQKPSSMGTLLGIGTFPWDAFALTNFGGLWVNSIAFGGGARTLSHELGHNVGLWHTFHGVSETSGCKDPCTENWHLVTDKKADYVGDFCKDTPATPMNFNCGPPTGRDCNRHSWESTDYTNIMGYADDSCMNHFTTEQMLRAHCWICNTLSGYLASPCSNDL